MIWKAVQAAIVCVTLTATPVLAEAARNPASTPRHPHDIVAREIVVGDTARQEPALWYYYPAMAGAAVGNAGAAVSDAVDNAAIWFSGPDGPDQVDYTIDMVLDYGPYVLITASTAYATVVVLRFAVRWHLSGGSSYVYGFFGPNGTVRYIGKGTGDRVTYHYSAAATNPTGRFQPWLAEQGAENVTHRILASGLTSGQAARQEAQLIHRFGRIEDGGPLLNLRQPAVNQSWWSWAISWW